MDTATNIYWSFSGQMDTPFRRTLASHRPGWPLHSILTHRAYFQCSPWILCSSVESASWISKIRGINMDFGCRDWNLKITKWFSSFSEDARKRRTNRWVHTSKTEQIGVIHSDTVSTASLRIHIDAASHTLLIAFVVDACQLEWPECEQHSLLWHFNRTRTMPKGE